MSNLQRMLNFSQKHNRTIKKFSDILKRHFDIENFWYAKTTQDGNHGALEANCSYQEYFFGSKQFTKHPLIVDHLKAQPGYICYSLIENAHFQDSLQDCEQKFKIIPAFGISRRIRGDLVRIGFSVNSEHYNKKVQNIISNVRLLEEFQAYFYREAAPLIREMDQNLFNVRKEIKESYPYQNTILSPPILNTNSRFLEELHGLKQGVLHSLTDRETECMKYLYQGLTSRQIGLEMHISCRTVESHMENIKLKLNCDSKNELVIYASLMAKCQLFN